MATNVRYWTRDDLEHLPDDGNRYEVLDGELFVTPQASVDHQYVAFRLAALLDSYCRQHGIGWVVGPGAIVFGKNELQPDVQVVPGAFVPGRKWDQLPQSILVCEVRSDSTYRRDIGKKREAYQRVRIPEYWVIDPAERVALVWVPTAEAAMVVTDSLRWHPRSDVDALEIPLVAILPPK